MLRELYIVAVAASLAGAQIGFEENPPVNSGSTGSSSKIFFPRDSDKPEVSCKTYEGEDGACRLLSKCATFYAEIAQLSRSPCNINNEQQGVCCPPTKEPTADIGQLITKKETTPVSIFVPDIQFPSLNHACEMGIQKVTQKEDFELLLLQKNVVAEKGSPTSLHAQLFQTSEEIVKKAKDASKNIEASVILKNEFKLNKEQGGFGLPNFSIQNTVIQDTCPKDPICPKTKYRALDGTCNNRANKNWGRAGTAFQRILFSDYDDGINSPRMKSKDGGLLESPRIISSNIILHKDNLYANFTLLIMQWGQFLDHDMTHTPLAKGSNMSDISCCHAGVVRSPSELHPECLPIDIPANDLFYSKHNQRCMHFVRSLPAVRPKCNFGPREQMNQITAFIDASNVYGSNVKDSNDLRTFTNGLLKESDKQHLLPPNPSECKDSLQQKFCFKAGDSRVNEQPQLAVMHTLWMREHNRLAKELLRFNPGWTDEIIFQEARRIVAAQMQHITYNEYLPIILGRKFMETFGLVPRKSGYAPGYNTNINPTITNVFATAAFRYGHTLISDSLETVSKFGTLVKNLELSKTQFAPFDLYEPGGFDEFVRGISFQHSQQFDHFFSEQLTNLLFAKKGFGMDLVALNIQRGRDHGLPPYNQWRKICDLPLARSFQDLQDVMDQERITKLQQLYSNVDDIDIFIGGILENPKEGSLLGHTFLCLVGDQFARLRLGDRFYYENGDLEPSFTEAQLDEIRQISLARILCDNSDNIEMMQPLAFIQPHYANKRVPCASDTQIPKMSLDPWRNEPVWA